MPPPASCTPQRGGCCSSPGWPSCSPPWPSTWWAMGCATRSTHGWVGDREERSRKQGEEGERQKPLLTKTTPIERKERGGHGDLEAKFEGSRGRRRARHRRHGMWRRRRRAGLALGTVDEGWHVPDGHRGLRVHERVRPHRRVSGDGM